jgi:hypothetical protein
MHLRVPDEGGAMGHWENMRWLLVGLALMVAVNHGARAVSFRGTNVAGAKVFHVKN